MAVDANKQALPRKYMESWRSERGDVTGVPSYTLSAGGGRGRLAGAAVAMICTVEPFWPASLKPQKGDAGNLKAICWVTAALASHAEFVADRRGYSLPQVNGVEAR
jgi:hypothetical protein